MRFVPALHSIVKSNKMTKIYSQNSNFLELQNFKKSPKLGLISTNY